MCTHGIPTPINVFDVLLLSWKSWNLNSSYFLNAIKICPKKTSAQAGHAGLLIYYPKQCFMFVRRADYVVYGYEAVFLSEPYPGRGDAHEHVSQSVLGSDTI